MSIDYGDKRIGIALSDPMQTISYPLCVINQKNKINSINEILKIAKEKEVEKLIIGLPLSMSGNYSEQTKKVISFKELLENEISNQRIKLYIDTIDERLSSVSAKSIMLEQGIKTGHNKGKIDQLSAAIILQEYLDSK
tara:strand:+ start:1792 stop:2205 length:414 start_codon:yes stop_codon:yes gene_type:complete